MHFHVLRFHFGALVSVSEWLEVGLKWMEMKFAANSASKSLRVVSGSHPKSLLKAYYKAVTSSSFPLPRIHSGFSPCAYTRERMEMVENL